MTGLSVNFGDLNDAAYAINRVNREELKGKANKAVSDTLAAGISLRGWSISSELESVSSKWDHALKGLQERMSAGAQALRDCANQHAWNDSLLGRDFERIR